MRFSEIIRSSLATMRMNGRRTVLTMIGIVIGIAAVITIMSLGNGFRKNAMNELTDDEGGRPSQTLSFQPGNFDAYTFETLEPFKRTDLDILERVPGVDQVELMKNQMNQQPKFLSVSYARQSESYQTANIKKTEDEILAGRNLSPTDDTATARVATVSSNYVAETFGGEEEKALGKIVDIEGTLFTIVGVFPASEAGFSIVDNEDSEANMEALADIKIPMSTFSTFLADDENEHAWSVKLFFDEGVDIKKVSQKAADALNEEGSAHSEGSYSFFDMSDIMEGIGNALNMITYFVAAVAAISLLIAGVGVMNMMYISVSERTKEIGIRRSLGATKASIQWQFLCEGIAMTTFGGIIGYGFGIGIALLVALLLPFDAAIDFGTAFLAVLISALVGVIFSVFPARAAAEKNVVEILR